MTTPVPTPPNIAPVPQLPQFRWNAAARQYIAPSGQFVPRSMVRRALDTFITHTVGNMRAVSQLLVAGELSLAQWQLEMMALSKQVNLAGAAMEAGGWYQMGAAEFGRVGAKIREEYGYLQQFANQVESGEQRLDGTLPRRAMLYGEQGRVTYYDASRASAASQGFDQERSILTPADHCAECVDQAARGYQPLGSMIPVGNRQCRSNCKCFVVYRDSTTGATRTV